MVLLGPRHIPVSLGILQLPGGTRGLQLPPRPSTQMERVVFYCCSSLLICIIPNNTRALRIEHSSLASVQGLVDVGSSLQDSHRYEGMRLGLFCGMITAALLRTLSGVTPLKGNGQFGS